jgi:hypothetical protein
MISSAMLPRTVRQTARRMGVGRALVRIRALRAITLRGAVAVARGRATYLPRIMDALPIPAGDGPLEVHMLLHHQRLLEGIWALYSFAHFTRLPCQIFVHSDGSLTDTDTARLEYVLPGARVISRDHADRVVMSRLQDLGLSTSIRFRNSLVFALKLFDPFFFGNHSSFFLLDSDVLFFQRPHELLADLSDPSDGGPVSLYSPDNGFRYCLSRETLRALLGQECIADFNPGVVRAGRSVLNLARIEQYLQRPEFWGSSSRPHYYGELTLWAMQLTAAGARQLPASYAITPPLDGTQPTSGHFCGGGYPATWFYSRGLPQLALEFGISL